jgi:predicted membrane protein DUF2306
MKGRALVLGGLTAVAMTFILAFGVPYINPDERRYALYASKRAWLLLHLASGTVALLVGPVQFWLGLSRGKMRLHRRLGLAYLASVATGSVSALYLALHTTLGWVFGMGLTALAIAWITTTGMAFVAIRRRMVPLHQEWMIRSYVVTFAFVTFRMLVGILQTANVGTVTERLAAASWFCWAVPLLVTEVILQGRKITGSVETDSRWLPTAMQRSISGRK